MARLFLRRAGGPGHFHHQDVALDHSLQVLGAEFFIAQAAGGAHPVDITHPVEGYLEAPGPGQGLFEAGQGLVKLALFDQNGRQVVQGQGVARVLAEQWHGCGRNPPVGRTDPPG